MGRERITKNENAAREQGDKRIGGCWFPLEVMMNPQLGERDKMVWWVIYMMDSGSKHCYATNEFIAARARTTPKTVSNIISNLVKLGYVIVYQQQDNKTGLGRVIGTHPKFRETFAAIRQKYEDEWSNAARGGTHPQMEGGIHPQMEGYPSTDGTDKNDSISTKKRLSSKDDNRTVVHQQLILKAIDELPGHIRTVMQHWYVKGLFTPAPGKTFDRSVHMINGLFTGATFRNLPNMNGAARVYTLQEVLRAIDAFALASFNPNYMPTDKKVFKYKYPNWFIYNQYGKNVPSNFGRSPFLYFLENGAEPIRDVPLLQDQNPELTGMLIHEYKKEILGGVMPKQMGNRAQNAFIRSAALLTEFCSKFRTRFNYEPTNKKLAEWITRCLINDVGEERDKLAKISPGWYCTDETMNRRFPAYLYNKRILNEDKAGNPWRGMAGHFSLPIEHPDHPFNN